MNNNDIDWYQNIKVDITPKEGLVYHSPNQMECSVIHETESGLTYIEYNGMTYRVEYNNNLDVWDVVELVFGSDIK